MNNDVLDRLDRVTQLLRTEHNVDPSTATELIATLASDSDPIVRHEAAFVLGHCCVLPESTIAEIRAALAPAAHNDSSVVVRHEATESLGHFQHSDVREVLEELCDSCDIDVAATARISLARWVRSNPP